MGCMALMLPLSVGCAGDQMERGQSKGVERMIQAVARTRGMEGVMAWELSYQKKSASRWSEWENERDG